MTRRVVSGLFFRLFLGEPKKWIDFILSLSYTDFKANLKRRFFYVYK